MFLRVAKVCWFMFYHLFIYAWVRVTRPAGVSVRLQGDFKRWSSYVLKVFSVDLRVEGRENIPPAGRRLIIMSNHQSQIDIPTLAAAMDRQLGFVAKRELGRIPLLGYWMKQIGCVLIDRSDKRGAHQAMEKAAREMGNSSLVVFPEGTRSKTGSLLPFKLGGARLAVLAQALILPVLIEGTRDAGENRKPGSASIPVRLRIFPPLDTQGMADGKPALNQIKNYVEQCWKNPSGPN